MYEAQRIPVLKVGENLITSIQIELSDRMVVQLQKDILEKIKKTGAKGLLIDVSSLDIIDSFIARSVINIARASKYLDTATVVTGISPEIAITLLQMGFRWEKVETATDVEHGFEKLGKLLRR
jgi:rsbT antagonist protein RsbS